MMMLLRGLEEGDGEKLMLGVLGVGWRALAEEGMKRERGGI